LSEPLAILLQHGYRYALSLTHHAAKAEDLLHAAWGAMIQAGGPHEKRIFILRYSQPIL